MNAQSSDEAQLRDAGDPFASIRHSRTMLVACLLALHLAVWSPPASYWPSPLLLIHLGLFLLWQPFWPEAGYGRGKGLLIVLSVCLLIGMLGWWLLPAWLLLAIAYVGGGAPRERRERLVYILILLTLIPDLLIGCLPRLAGSPVAGIEAGRYILLLPLFAITAAPPFRGQPDQRQVLLNPPQGLLLALLTGLSGGGGLLLVRYADIPYLLAVFWMLLGLSTLLIVLSRLLPPTPQGGRLTRLWAYSLLRLGPPLEQWLAQLSQLVQTPCQPEDFLDRALDRLAELPGIAGADWRAGRHRGRRGATTPHELRVLTGELAVSVYAQAPVSGPLALHCRLFVQLVRHFYSVKKRERQLAQQAHLQAVHETGARLTHEIKNMVQSLQTILSLYREPRKRDDPELRAALDRQLASLTTRLRLSLEKLSAPGGETETTPAALGHWWPALQDRYAAEPVVFQGQEAWPDGAVPAELFDTVADNLLENARQKRLSHKGLRVRVRLQASDGQARLTVCDDGPPLPPSLTRRLFAEPAESRYGLGIGLYQCARMAERLGYSLLLQDNRQRRVCLELQGPLLPKPDPAAEPAAPAARLEPRERNGDTAAPVSAPAGAGEKR